MSRLIKFEISLLLLFQFIDLATTLQLLSIGGHEFNPFVNFLLHVSGIYGFWGAKLLLIAFLPLVTTYMLKLPQKRRSTILWLHAVNIFYFFVVSINLSNFIR